MKKNNLEKRVAQLESINDQLTSEFNHLNVVLKKLGFDEGIKTLKEAATEMLHKDPPPPPIEDFDRKKKR